MLTKFMHHYPELVKLMQSTYHDSSYHLEGSVWTHTCMVYSYVQAIHPDNKVLLAAAILHDIGKCYTGEVIDGRTSFKSHEGVSTMLATDILPIFDLTEQEKIDVLKVISLHGVNVSQLSVPYLSMFRKADATGRITNKDTRKDYEPRRFHKPTSTPKFNVTFLVGLPCSRKSTYAKSLGLDILSRDDLLTSQHTALSYNQAYSLVHSNSDSLAKFNQSFEQYITSKARAGKDLIIDMTMLSLKSRRSMMTHFKHASFNAIVFLPKYSQVLECNATRPGKSISPEILHSMSKSFVMPVLEEGFTNISYILEP